MYVKGISDFLRMSVLIRGLRWTLWAYDVEGNELGSCPVEVLVLSMLNPRAPYRITDGLNTSELIDNDFIDTTDCCVTLYFTSTNLIQ